MVYSKEKLSQKCIVKECDNNFYAIGYCQPHYQKNRKYGDPLKFINMRSKTGLCTFSGCNKKYMGKGYCRTHYDQFIATDEDRVRDRNRIRKRARRLRKEVMILLGGIKCRKCGFKDFRALQIDHKKGGGKNERSLTSNSVKFYLFCLKNPIESKIKYQVLCANCNWIKRHTNKELRTIETMRSGKIGK